MHFYSAFYKQKLINAARTKDLIVMGDFSTDARIVEDHLASAGRSTNFLVILDNLFLSQTMEGLTRGKGSLDLVLTKRENLERNLNIGCTLGNSDHELIRFIIHRKSGNSATHMTPACRYETRKAKACMEIKLAD